ncbi:hypothetical protein GUF72_18020 [Xanthomonas citri pv. citri]|uniref:Uncharacterized protein n=4 Tax=Xanthomonas TaxID=338 RepID=A0AAI7ZGD4_XANAC|nr:MULTISPECIES: hypothetical protein [Xanthomonas]AAM37506.1 hypothetical protein XAC2659 [Xanthomonas citri pv. citri str. 306]AGH78147.1 hypothetical protein XAC29_13555 [Xanthomonas axonopodis Xac29-1]AJD69257.1 hypothetical protein J151_02843 [Xanthomonas citri subsp. citri A306]AJY91638.1 hypothetical protein J169_02841 [Xanthomonas citri pv. citri]AJY96094.1 hypothetical protein J164_02826 [Xanthomonas citri pv. citri]
MATGYRTGAGLDFDDIFDLYVQGEIGSVTGYRSSDGNDLHRRYAPLAFGSRAADVGYRDNAGSDLSNKWSRKGSAVYSLSNNGVHYYAGSQAVTSEGGSQTASVSFSIRANGTWALGLSGKGVSGSPTSGTWLPNGQPASNYSVQLDFSVSWLRGNRNGTSSNSAANYSPMTGDYACSITSRALSGSGNECYGEGKLTIRIRNNATGSVSTTAISLVAEAVGFA